MQDDTDLHGALHTGNDDDSHPINLQQRFEDHEEYEVSSVTSSLSALHYPKSIHVGRHSHSNDNNGNRGGNKHSTAAGYGSLDNPFLDPLVTDGSHCSSYDGEEEERYSDDDGGGGEWGANRRAAQYGEEFLTISWDQDELREKRKRHELYGRSGVLALAKKIVYASSGWWVVFFIGVATAVFAGMIEHGSEWYNDLKEGICPQWIWLVKRQCCVDANDVQSCVHWYTWAEVIMIPKKVFDIPLHYAVNYAAFVFWAVVLAGISAWFVKTFARYAAGSGISEVKVILGGFTIKKYLGIWTLVIKMVGLTLAVGSGLAVGKEGPMVHVACCAGNIFSRLFTKYHKNEAKKRELLSAASAAGVSAAFGAPVGGVLFSLEEASSFFPPKTLYRSFFASVTAAVALTIINPRGTDKLTLFAISYRVMWNWFELIPFILLGVMGGVIGALYCKFNRVVAILRKRTFLHKMPITEVVAIAFLTATLKYWNHYTRSSMPELIHALFNNQCSPNVSKDDPFQALCTLDNYEPILYLIYAGVMYFVVATLSFGIRVPSGLFVPCLTVGAIFGHLIGTVVKHVQESSPDSYIFTECRSVSEGHICVVPGIYALVGAAAMLGGATRVTVSLAVMMFELTGGLEYILPIMIASMVSKWVGDAIAKESMYEMHIELNKYPYLKDEVESTGTASDAMTPTGADLKVICADNCSVFRIRTLLRGKRYHGFPVVESKHSFRVVGYLSRLNLMKGLLMHKDRMDMNTMIVFDRQLELSERQSLLLVGPNKMDFSEYLDSSPVHILPTASIDRMFTMFKSMGLRYCLVCKNNILEGIITKKDVIHFLRHHR